MTAAHHERAPPNSPSESPESDEDGVGSVNLDGKPCSDVERSWEWVNGEILCQWWHARPTGFVRHRTGPRTGVVGWSIFPGVLKRGYSVNGQTDVGRSIAYDAKRDRLFRAPKHCRSC